MDKIHIVKIRKIAFTKLRKLEVFMLYKHVVDVISDYDTMAMHIGDTCDLLIGMHSKAAQLQSTEKDFGPHILTPRVKKLHEKRLRFAAIITNHMITVEKAGFKDTLHLVELVKPMMLAHLNYLRKNDQIAVEELINMFFYQLKQKPEIKDALYELKFKPYLDELESANNAYKKLYKERGVQFSRRPKGSTLPVQRELQNMLNILFSQVDYYQHVYKDVDYSKLITGLNTVIATYTKLIKTRDTQRKNKKMKLKDDEEAALEEKIKMDRIENNPSDMVNDKSATSTPTDVTRKQKDRLPVSKKKKKGKDEPINRLLNILKKPDKGEKEDSDEDQ